MVNKKKTNRKKTQNKTNINQTQNKTNINQTNCLVRGLKNVGNLIKRNKKLLLLLLVFIIISVLLKITFNLYMIKEYKSYTDKIEMWGYDKMYSNQKTTAYEKVTKSDMVKLLISASLNINDVSGIENGKETFENENWIKAGNLFDIIEDNQINKKNHNKTANLVETSIVVTKAKENILKQDFNISKEIMNHKLIKKTKENEKYINEAISMRLIKNKNISLNKKINKGEFAKILVTYLEETSALHYDRNMTIEKDIDKMPKTYKQYPYIIKEIDNIIYDMPLQGTQMDNFNTPITVYKTRKEIYSQTVERIEQYYNTILNIDYRTINKTELENAVEEYSLYENDSESYEKYIDHVKKNKIIIKGNIDIYLPITYYDGFTHRIRTKITFKVLSSTTQENLLLPDFITKAKNRYLDKDYSLYTDIMVEQSYNSISQRIFVMSLNNMLTEQTDRITQN